MLTLLPADVLITLLHLAHFDLNDLVALSQTCHIFYALVHEFGWAEYHRRNPRPSDSLAKARAKWTPVVRIKYDISVDNSWAQFQFVARPLSSAWPYKEQPVIATNSSRLVVAAGISLHSYTFGESTGCDSPPIVFEGSCSLGAHRDRSNYITALAFISDQILCLGFQDGTCERIVINGPSKRKTLRIQRGSRQQLHYPDSCESLSYSRVATESPSSSVIDLQVRSWCSHLCMESTSPYAAFGTSSATPLTIHEITNDRVSPLPTAVLHQTEHAPGSAVYGISRGPPSSPWGASPWAVVSGWYNGTVSIHDLRSSSRGASIDPALPAPLNAVLNLRDPWSLEPIYSVSCGGGSGSHVAAGSARHSLVSLWDVRSPIKRALSLHAPFNDPSPVYDVILESSRLFGVTQSRPFVLDFGPGLSTNTFPPLGNLNEKLDYYVTQYLHPPS
ncbi:hypothetical protein FB45DRAFT_975799 [Roridomyces roridus]|uniref:F-box domain-containing protein n=1 Tax=Roridomyces roridus TaxID=1738132 RepID=A0AAD7FUN6_9AGAR|nr:hypothetical protein FB45DRAFT_975799 [Roridomyces roridus]